MISVRLDEKPRKFDVRIGDKLVGRLTVYTHGQISASIIDPETESGWRWVDGGFRTLKQATNRVLRTAGYGNCLDVEATKCKGFRIR